MARDKKTTTITLYSDSNYAHFMDQASYRHAENAMKADPAKLTVTFEGEIDHVLRSHGRQLGGKWSDKE